MVAQPLELLRVPAPVFEHFYLKPQEGAATDELLDLLPRALADLLDLLAALADHHSLLGIPLHINGGLYPCNVPGQPWTTFAGLGFLCMRWPAELALDE